MQLINFILIAAIGSMPHSEWDRSNSFLQPRFYVENSLNFAPDSQPSEVWKGVRLNKVNNKEGQKPRFNFDDILGGEFHPVGPSDLDQQNYINEWSGAVSSANIPDSTNWNDAALSGNDNDEAQEIPSEMEKFPTVNFQPDKFIVEPPVPDSQVPSAWSSSPFRNNQWNGKSNIFQHK